MLAMCTMAVSKQSKLGHLLILVAKSHIREITLPLVFNRYHFMGVEEQVTLC